MAIAIKALPMLYGEDAIHFREEIEKVDEQYDNRSVTLHRILVMR